MPTASEISSAICRFGKEPLRVLEACEGFYKSPTDHQGKPLGPLVQYRKQYAPGKHYVGWIYVNFAMAEQWPFAVRHFAHRLLPLLDPNKYEIDAFCGAPEGGKCLAHELAACATRRYVYPERERKSDPLLWGRHSPLKGERVAIVEDVVNSASTTEKLVKLIMDAGAVPVLLTCFLNRSTTIETKWSMDGFPELPVIPLVRQRIDQYRQDDPEVIDHIKRGHLITDVKKKWPTLMQTMRATPTKTAPSYKK